MKHTRSLIAVLLPLAVLAWSGCTRYLDAKPDQQLFIPTKVADLQALLDYHSAMNQNDPYVGEASADNYYLTESDWAALPTEQRRLYAWEPDFIFPTYPNQWSDVYEGIFLANTVLANGAAFDGPERMRPEWGQVRGQALFHRARLFLAVATVWAPAYDEATSDRDLGIPLRLTDDFNEPSVRASVADTYARIIIDLQEAIRRLPETDVSPMRPTKTAAHALLARVYLSMCRYDEAGRHADTAYRKGTVLMNYNTLNPALARPFDIMNSEVIFHGNTLAPTQLAVSRAKVDSVLFASFTDDDLRKTLFFQHNANGTQGFKGNYTGGTGLFSGIAADEVYLMKAECDARAGRIGEAMAVLNELLVTRWQEGTFVPLIASTPAAALDIVLLERRKELIYRGLRWMDLKRLNKEGYGIELVRQLGGTRYVLPPNDPRYALAIPEDVINLSGMPQNPR